MYEQESLSDVLKLVWFKRHKQNFDDENPESLMIKKPKISPREEMKVDRDFERSAFSDEEEEEQIPSFLQKIEPVGHDKVNNQDKSVYQDLLKAQMLEESLRSKIEEEQNMRLIDEIMKEQEVYERQDSESKRQQEMESMIAAQRLQDELEREEIKMREDEAERNKPE